MLQHLVFVTWVVLLVSSPSVAVNRQVKQAKKRLNAKHQLFVDSAMKSIRAISKTGGTPAIIQIGAHFGFENNDAMWTELYQVQNLKANPVPIPNRCYMCPASGKCLCCCPLMNLGTSCIVAFESRCVMFWAANRHAKGAP